ncbi:MAG: hypothetical protein Q9222_003979 [Ikaeria aurantiellina]
MTAQTHDISLIDYHVKDVKTLGRILDTAAASAFPRTSRCRYQNVCVLLLSWEDDDLGVAKEVDRLEDVFRDTYHYSIKRWKIPSSRSHNKLTSFIIEALEELDFADKLCITYYAGHGYMNEDRQCVWLCNQKKGAATLQWSSIQTMLEEAECDSLILLDCCAAGSSGGNHGKGVTEVIAACGFESYAPGVGEHSFTTSLIAELKYLSRRHSVLTTALLHNKVLARVKKSWNPRYDSTDNNTQERRRTPIHIHLSDNARHRCIELPPRLAPPTTTGRFEPLTGTSSESSAPSTSISDDTDTQSLDNISPGSSISEVWLDPQFQLPKVVISIALQEDQRLAVAEWMEWLMSIPALTARANIEGVYKSDSTLILLSLPVAMWDALPPNPAMKFIAYIRSSNMLGAKMEASSRPLLQSPAADLALLGT